MEKIICPRTGAECADCTAGVLSSAVVALRGRRDTAAARVIAEDVFEGCRCSTSGAAGLGGSGGCYRLPGKAAGDARFVG